MPLNSLYKKRQINFSLSIWQIASLAGAMLLVLYIAWELFWYNQVGMAAIKQHTYIVGGVILLWLFTIPVSFIGFIRKSLMLGLVYLILCLLIGEVHPFTKMPMYDRFVNYAYSFKVTDKAGNIIPANRHYRVNCGSLAHKFYVICNTLQVNCGFEKETTQELQLVGKQLLKELEASRKTNPPADTICLYLVNHYFDNDSIVKTERLMYAAKVGQ